MAKVTVNGDAVVITSSVKFEDLKMLAKYRKKALNLYGGKDGEELLYSIGIVKGAGSINKCGAEFGAGTRDADGFATMTLVCSDMGKDADAVKEYIADKYGEGLILLNQLEETIPPVLEEVKAQKQAVMDGITLA